MRGTRLHNQKRATKQGGRPPRTRRKLIALVAVLAVSPVASNTATAAAEASTFCIQQMPLVGAISAKFDRGHTTRTKQRVSFKLPVGGPLCNLQQVEWTYNGKKVTLTNSKWRTKAPKDVRMSVYLPIGKAATVEVRIVAGNGVVTQQLQIAKVTAAPSK